MKANQPSYSYIGKAAPRIEGEKKVSGQALYTADHLMAGTVWGKVLRSPYPHARITRVNTDRAKAYPGVLAVLTAADIPAVLTGRRLRDMPQLRGAAKAARLGQTDEIFEPLGFHAGRLCSFGMD